MIPSELTLMLGARLILTDMELCSQEINRQAMPARSTGR